MANNSNHRQLPRPESKTRARHTTQPISDGLRSAITDSGLSAYALDKKSDIERGAIGRFVSGKTSLTLASADKLAIPLRVKVVRMAEARWHEPKAPLNTPPQPLADALRLEIARSGRSFSGLAREVGLDHASVGKFFNRKRHLTLVSADKLAISLGLELFLKSGSKASDDHSTQPLTDGLLAAIDADGRSVYALAKAAGICDASLSRFVGRETSLTLVSADKLAVPLGVNVVCEAKAQRPESKPRISRPQQPFLGELLSAITESGLSNYEISKRSGVPCLMIRRIKYGQRDIKFITASKLAEAVGLKLEPARLQARSAEVSTPAAVQPIGPISELRNSSTSKKNLLTI